MYSMTIHTVLDDGTKQFAARFEYPQRSSWEKDIADIKMGQELVPAPNNVLYEVTLYDGNQIVEQFTSTDANSRIIGDKLIFI